MPSVEALADAVARVRRGEKSIEVLLVGDAPSLWFIEREARGFIGFTIRYRKLQTAPVPVEELDAACRDAVQAVFRQLWEYIDRLRWHTELARILDVIISVWPELSSVLSVMQPASKWSVNSKGSK
jgi:hypothetical protein